MRECWINVYPGLLDPDAGEGHYLGQPARDRMEANEHACGCKASSSRMLRKAGVGYRLHVRLKVPALPATDALAAVKAGEDENGRAA